MRMAKQRRKYERLLEVARQVWRDDQVAVRAAEAQRLATIASVRKVLDSHKTILRQDPFGRRGAMRAYCTYCVTNPAPCPTSKALTKLLDELAVRV